MSGVQDELERLRQEIDSLAGEIVHAYEELHLLYELGEVLTSDLSEGEVANLILDKILYALDASHAELVLSSGEAVRVISSAGAPASGSPERRLSTVLRSAGEAVGTLELARAEDAAPFSSGDSKLLDAVGTFTSNAVRKVQLVEQLRENEARLRAVLENVAEGILTVDERGRITSCNAAAEAIFGYAAREVVGQPAQLLVRALASGESTGQRRDRSSFPADLSVGEMQLHGQRHHVLSVRDITERKRAEAALEHQALHDALTDLPNRVLLHDRVEQALRASHRSACDVALLVMDLDRFKDVNDTFGHDYGDMLLRQLGARLREVLREADTIARLGGDEFAVLLPVSTHDDAVDIAQRLLSVLEQPFPLGGLQLEIEASIGVALAPEHGSDVDTLLRRADVAMYVAKRSGTGYAVYTFEQDQHSPERLALVGELRRAIDNAELWLFYQPKLSLSHAHVTCVEALVRWRHPVHGMIGPDQFVPVAEQTGLIRPLSRWVVEAALRQCRAWRQAGLDIAVAVNLSMRNLHDPLIVEMIGEQLKRWKVPPSRLTVEITETSLMADAAHAMHVLERLRAMGVSISIDDFGTGYSSLAYLKRLPVDELKIDKSFVSHMATDDNDAAIVRSTVGLAHDLGLRVVAEGVEDLAVWQALAELGCDLVQGYVISRPLPAGELTRWLLSERSTPRLARAA